MLVSSRREVDFCFWQACADADCTHEFTSVLASMNMSFGSEIVRVF